MMENKCQQEVELEPSRDARGNEQWCHGQGKQFGGSSKKENMELPYDPAILSQEYAQGK